MKPSIVFVVFIAASITAVTISPAKSPAKNSNRINQIQLNTTGWINRLNSSKRAKTWQLIAKTKPQDYRYCMAWGSGNVSKKKVSHLINAWLKFLSKEAHARLPKTKRELQRKIDRLIVLGKKFGREGSFESLAIRDAIFRIVIFKYAKFEFSHPLNITKSLFGQSPVSTLKPFSRSEIEHVIPTNITDELHRKYVSALNQKPYKMWHSLYRISYHPAERDDFANIYTSAIISSHNIYGLAVRMAETKSFGKLQLPAFFDYIASGGTMKELKNYNVFVLIKEIRKDKMQYSCPLLGIKKTRPADILAVARWIDSDHLPRFVAIALK